jgi:hypothetical protein
MSQPKGKIPNPIKPKKFQHPKEKDHLIQVLTKVEDPRKPSCNFRYSLVSILFIYFSFRSTLRRQKLGRNSAMCRRNE